MSGELDLGLGDNYIILYRNLATGNVDIWCLGESAVRVNYSMMVENKSIELLGVAKVLDSTELDELLHVNVKESKNERLAEG